VIYYFGTIDGKTWWTEDDPLASFYSSPFLKCWAGTLNRNALKNFKADFLVNRERIVWIDNSKEDE
jgi:hypothetical protein